MLKITFEYKGDVKKTLEIPDEPGSHVGGWQESLYETYEACYLSGHFSGDEGWGFSYSIQLERPNGKTRARASSPEHDPDMSGEAEGGPATTLLDDESKAVPPEPCAAK